MLRRSRQNVDIELASRPSSRPARLDGFPSFAEFIAEDRDAEIYRKFGHLSSRNLLYLQSELHELEAQLQELDREDAKDIGNETAQKVARHWRDYSDESNDRARQHRALQRKIKEKMKEYRTS